LEKGAKNTLSSENVVLGFQSPLLPSLFIKMVQKPPK